MSKYEDLLKLNREDEVKSSFLLWLNITLDMRYNIDCYSENILFEFKYNSHFKKEPIVLAQAI
jgi:hypothetical protein